MQHNTKDMTAIIPSNKRFDLHSVNSLMDKGFRFELPAETQTLIASLAAEVGSPEYQKTPVFISKPKRNRKKPVKMINNNLSLKPQELQVYKILKK